MTKLPKITPTAPASARQVDRFLTEAKAVRPRHGTQRLIFAMDATASRAPTWDLACSLHADLFDAAREAHLAVQLVFFRGVDELRASRFSATPDALLRAMSSVRCLGGMTQIVRVIDHAARQAAERPIRGLILVGDSFEEDAARAAAAAGRLALYNVPMFVFQEGTDPRAATVFRELARVTAGAHLPFQPGSAAELKGLLRAVAAFAAGGRGGLERALGNPMAKRLLAQLP